MSAATLLLVTAAEGASGKSGGGCISQHGSVFIFSLAPLLFLEGRVGKIRKRAKSSMYPRAFKGGAISGFLARAA
jgi:hypothetical protein